MTSLLGLVTLAPVTTGCAGLRPYSEVRDKQAKAAADAWKEVNLGAEMAAHRANLKVLLGAENGGARRRWQEHPRPALAGAG